MASARATQPRSGDQFPVVGKFRVLVVLAHVDERQLPEHGDVGGLVPDALVDGAVAEEGHADAALALPLGGEGTAGGDADPAAHDPVGAQDAQRDVRDVHLAALAAAVAGDAAHHFGHHGFHPPALGDDMAVAAVRAGDGVILAQGGAYAHRGGFLSVGQVRQAGHQAPAVNVENGFLEGPDGEHLAVHLEQRLRREWQVVGWCLFGRHKLINSFRLRPRSAGWYLQQPRRPPGPGRRLLPCRSSHPSRWISGSEKAPGRGSRRCPAGRG